MISVPIKLWHPTLVLLPGKSHGWRSLEGCSPWGCWGSDTTEQPHFHFSLSCIGEGNGNPLQCSCLENSRVHLANQIYLWAKETKILALTRLHWKNIFTFYIISYKVTFSEVIKIAKNLMRITLYNANLKHKYVSINNVFILLGFEIYMKIIHSVYSIP